MTDDEIDFDIVITRRPEPERKLLFVCCLCKHEVEECFEARWRDALRQRDPVCNSCTRSYGSKPSGPVFNRRNYHRLKQLSAAINCLTWEVKNGRRFGHR